MATKAITVRVEFAVKKQAEAMLEEMGLDMSTYIIASVKALVREKKIPFPMVTAQYITERASLEISAAPASEEAAPAKFEQVQSTTEIAEPEVETSLSPPEPEDELYIAQSEPPEIADPEKIEPTHWVASGYTPDKIVLEKLAGAEQEARDPNTKLLSHGEVFSKLRERHMYEI